MADGAATGLARPNSHISAKPYLSLQTRLLAMHKYCHACQAKPTGAGICRSARTTCTPKVWHATAVTVSGLYSRSRAKPSQSTGGQVRNAASYTLLAKRCRPWRCGLPRNANAMAATCRGMPPC